jgi:AdoMet-dependent rRNA methyltransferase SPB1
MPSNSLIVGVDLAPIKPISRCITFQSDITTDKCRATLRQHLKTWKADTVLHDGAPNVGTAWVQDAFSQAELVLQSLKLATEFLIEGGNFVTKIFRSKDYNSLLWVFNQLFDKVEATKPPSSRNVSAEIFVVCRGFKAPKRIDPKFLDPRSVFAELSAPTPNNEAKVFNPEKKRRKREGYEEGDWTQYKEAPVTEFIQTTDPIDMLGTYNKFSFQQQPNGDIALATINKLPETTQEIRDCCEDLKVLGRKEFRLILKWRLRVREIFGFSSKKKDAAAEEDEEVAEVESMDEELQEQEEIQRLKEQEDKSKRKARRKENERKQKDIVRMQMHMTTPMEIGMEQAGPHGEDSMFDLKKVDNANGLNQIAKGKMHSVVQEAKPAESSEEEEDSDSDADALERDLDAAYDQYQERKVQADAKYRVKRARKQYEKDDEWEGFSDDKEGQESGSDSDDLQEDDDSSDSSDEEDEGPGRLTTDLEGDDQGERGLTRRAALFFDQDIFDGIDDDEGAEDGDSGIDVEEEAESTTVSKPPSQTAKSSKATSKTEKKGTKQTSKAEAVDTEPTEEAENDGSDFEVVKDTTSAWDRDSEPMKNGRPDIDIITAEAMTLAQQLASGQKTKAELLDDNFNKYSLRDVDGLPDWFLDDEDKHSRPIRPITAAAAAAIKEKQRALNARPIKKVQEAKARKKFKAAQKMEKLKKKSALLLEDEGVSEKEKAATISRMMARAAKKKPKRQVKVVVARGGNRGVKGRPGGTKGKYKMVDTRLKKDIRAQKRVAKKNR